MAYFQGFQDALEPEEAVQLSVGKATDAGGDSLPFNHLEDRRFEILVYRLKYIELATGGERVTLMQGVGERGRDIVVYSAAGAVTQIIQCKNYGKRFTAPELRKELVKIALHNHLDPSIFGDGVVAYELWCPGGLTEPAAKLLDTWPRGWTAQAVAEDAVEVIGSYSAFKGMDWDAVGEAVVSRFQSIVRPSYRDGIIISALVRKHHSIHDAFFQGKIVMERDETLEAVRRAVAEGFGVLTDKDIKHIIERLASFPPEKRIVHMSGYVMGLSRKLVSRFNSKEYEAFAKHSVQPTTGIIQVVQNACARLASEAAREFREDVRPTNKSITDVFSRTLVFSMLAQVNGMIMPSLKLQPGLEAYAALSLRERFRHHTQRVWDDYQGCIAGYDPKKHELGSDEEFRSRIATHGLDGAKTKVEFEARLLTAVDECMDKIRVHYDRFMELVPDSIVVITDTRSAFENKWLFERMVESTETLTRLRGSAIIPD